jgi:Protein of unknown function (DUF3828)
LTDQTKLFTGLMALAILALPGTVGAADQGVQPSALVKDLYARRAKGTDPFSKPEDRALVERFFDKPLADAIRKDAADAKGEVGAMDADPLYDAQDMDIKKFAIGAAEMTGETAKVVVSFENLGEKTAVTYLLVKRAVGWRISDIQYGEGPSLLAIYKNATR